MDVKVSSSYTGVVPRDDSYRATYRTYGRVPLQTSDSHYSGREGIKQHDIQSSRNYIETVYPFESPAGSVRSSLSFPYSYAGHTDPVPLQFNHKTQGEPMSMHGPSPSLYGNYLPVIFLAYISVILFMVSSYDKTIYRPQMISQLGLMLQKIVIPCLPPSAKGDFSLCLLRVHRYGQLCIHEGLVSPMGDDFSLKKKGNSENLAIKS